MTERSGHKECSLHYSFLYPICTVDFFPETCTANRAIQIRPYNVHNTKCKCIAITEYRFLYMPLILERINKNVPRGVGKLVNLTSKLLPFISSVSYVVRRFHFLLFNSLLSNFSNKSFSVLLFLPALFNT